MPTTTTRIPTDRADLLAAIRAAGLLTPAQLTRATAGLQAQAAYGPPGTVKQDTQFLIAAGHLTRFQAERLLAGRTDGFVLDPYVIQEQIGRGPAGRVYKAVHRTMNRVVAIKVFGADQSRTPATRAALQDAARAAARLDHPNVVATYDANEVGGRFYLVTEHVDGPSLETLVRDRGPLPPAEACELVRQAATGLQYAYGRGMAHRDITPANLLVGRASKSRPGCVVKISDYGTSRLPGGNPDADGEAGLVGTPAYVAPELVRGPYVADDRADLYSLGCVFYFLLTGRPPFSGGTTAEKVRRHLTETPVPVERVRPDVPPAVAAVVGRLLAKDPNARFPSAAAVVAGLTGLASGAAAVDDGTAVHFNLSPAPAGSYSHSSGYLTGLQAKYAQAAAETGAASPWAGLTDEMLRADPTPPNGTRTRHKLPAGRRRAGGVAATVVLCGAAVVACLLGLGYLLREMVKM